MNFKNGIAAGLIFLAGCVGTPEIVRDFASVYPSNKKYFELQRDIYFNKDSVSNDAKARDFFDCSLHDAEEFVDAQSNSYELWKNIKSNRHSINIIHFSVLYNLKLKNSIKFYSSLDNLQNAFFDYADQETEKRYIELKKKLANKAIRK